MLPHLYKRSVIGRRLFSTAFTCHASVQTKKKERRTRRSHGGGVQVPLTSLAQRKKEAAVSTGFKPVNRAKKAEAKQHDDLLAELSQEHGVQMRWKSYIDGEEAGARPGWSSEERVRGVLEKLIGFSEYTKVGGLEKDVWTLLKRQVAVYDTMVGPVEGEGEGEGEGERHEEGGVRFEFPRDIREAILQCRENRDYANMLRLYDYFFQLLAKGPLMHQIERREELYRVNFGDGGAAEEVRDELNGLLDRLDECRRVYGADAGVHKGDMAVALYERRLVQQLEAAWYRLEAGMRNLSIYHDGFGRLVKALGSRRYGALFGAPFVDEFCRDLLGSEMGMEYDEVTVMLRNIARCQRFDRTLYVRLKDEVTGQMQLALTPELYCVFVEAALASREYGLVEEVLGDFYGDGYLVDRGLFVLLLRYYSTVGDEARLLRTVELLVHEFRVPLFEQELAELVGAFVRVGLRSAAVDVVKSLMIVNNAYQERVAEDEDSEDTNTDANTDADGAVEELEDPLWDVGMFTACCGADTLATVPVLTEDVVCPVLATSPSLAEFDETWRLLEEEPGFVLTSELVKLRLLVLDRFGVFGRPGGAQQLQNVMVAALSRLDLVQIDRLVLDPEFVEVFAKTAGVLLEAGELDGDSADVAAAYGAFCGDVGDTNTRVADAIDASTDAAGSAAVSAADGVADARQRLRETVCAPRVQHVLVLAGIAATAT